MIEAAQTFAINAPINGVWDYARDMAKWAAIFPGCRDCNEIDENNSEWTIKVGVGGLVRTVNVHVHVDAWDGPGAVDFSYKLQAEPAVGSGSYRAVATGQGETEVTLRVEIQGSGQMAPMWEAMCKPLIPTLLKSFSGDFKAALETGGEGAVLPVAKPSIFRRLLNWIASIWRRS